MFKFKVTSFFVLAAVLICCTFAYAASADTLDFSDFDGDSVTFAEFSAADVYVDGVCVAENTNSVPKDAIGLGRHSISAVSGGSVVFQKEYNVVNSYFDSETLYDFSDYTGENYTVGSKKVFVQGGTGMLGKVSVDENHGTSLGLLYRDSATASSWMRNDFVSPLAHGGLETMRYELEIYSSEHVKDYSITLVNNGKNYINFINFLGSGSSAAPYNIRIYSDGKRYADVPYDSSGVWYKVAFDITMQENGGALYNLHIYKYNETSQDFDEVYNAENLSAPATLVSLTGLRFSGPYADDDPSTYLAVDNVLYSYKYTTPIVSTINGFDAVTVDFKSSYIELGLSGTIISDSVSKDSVTVMGPLGEVDISDVTVLNGDIIGITLGESLESNSNYTVILDKSVNVTENSVLGYNLTQKIATSKNSAEVENVKISDSKITADVENTTDEDINIHVIVTYFNGEEYLGTRAFDFTAAKSGTSAFDESHTAPSGCTEIQVSFADKYINPWIIKSVGWRH